MSEALYLKIENNQVYIKATGHVTASLCAELRERVFAFLQKSDFADGIYLDLSECLYMDSTFMGVIVTMTKKLKAKSGNILCLYRPSQECLGLLKNLGILKLLKIENEAMTWPSTMDFVSGKTKTDSALVYQAHEELSQISPENRDKFKVLQELLIKEIEEK